MKRVIINENTLKKLVVEAIKNRMTIKEADDKVMYGYNLYGCGDQDLDYYSRERWEDPYVAYHDGFDALKKCDTDYKNEIHFYTEFDPVVKRRNGEYRNFNEEAYKKGINLEVFGVVK